MRHFRRYFEGREGRSRGLGWPPETNPVPPGLPRPLGSVSGWGRVSSDNGRSWTARLTVDDELVVFCPRCDDREFRGQGHTVRSQPEAEGQTEWPRNDLALWLSRPAPSGCAVAEPAAHG